MLADVLIFLLAESERAAVDQRARTCSEQVSGLEAQIKSLEEQRKLTEDTCAQKVSAIEALRQAEVADLKSRLAQCEANRAELAKNAVRLQQEFEQHVAEVKDQQLRERERLERDRDMLAEQLRKAMQEKQQFNLGGMCVLLAIRRVVWMMEFSVGAWIQ